MGNTSEPIYALAEEPPNFVAGGPVQAANGLYLERAADQELLELCRTRAFAYILTSRQMGKSSLMVRTARQLLREGVRSVILDLTSLGSLLSTEQWYGGIIETIADKLDIPGAAEWWGANQSSGISQRFIRFFREKVLVETGEPIVVFVDEIDSTLALSFSDDFFAAIRFLYHLRANDPELNRLSFVLIGVASPDDLIKDSRRTPFNIGRRVNLSDFTLAEAGPLVAGLGLSPIEATLFLDWVLRWTGGHPYLTLRVFQRFQQEGLAWVTDDAVIQQLFLGGESPDSNLEFVRKMIVKDDPIRGGVLSTYESIFHGQHVSDGPGAIKTCLKLSGLVVAREGALEIRNRIYETVFDKKWLTGLWEEEKRQLEQTRSPVAPDAPPATQVGRAIETSGGWDRPGQPPSLRLTANRIERSVLIAVESLLRSPNSEASQFLYGSLPLLRKQRFRIGHRQKVTAVAFSPDGRFAASASDDESARVFEIRGGQETALLKHRDRVSALAFSRDSNFLATASWDGSAKVWTVPGGRLAGEATHDDCVSAVAFLGNGMALATASWDHTARIWDLSPIARGLTGASNRQLNERRILVHNDRVSALAASAEGEWIATASWDHHARLWHARSGSQIDGFEHKSRVSDVAISSNGRLVATASEDSTAGIWDTQTRRKILAKGHDARVTRVAICDNPPRVATASEDRTARTWDLTSGVELERFCHLGRVTGLAFSRNDLLITSSEDGMARLWHAQTGQELARLSHDGRVASAVLSADGGLALSAGEDGTARVWDVTMPAEMNSFTHSDQVRGLAFSYDGGLLASASEDCTARVWDWAGAGEALRISHSARVTSVAFSRDNRLLTTGEDGCANIWSAAGVRLAQLRHPSWVYCAAFVDSAHAITACDDHQVRLWDFEAGKLVASFPHGSRVWAIAVNETMAHFASAGTREEVLVWGVASRTIPVRRLYFGEEVYALKMNPAGTALAAGSAGGRIRVWDLLSGAAIQELTGEAGVYSLDFSPDGQFLLAGYGDGAIRVWDLSSGRETLRLQESDRVHAAVFHPGGKFIAIASRHRIRISLWKIPDVVAFARAHLTRNLTQGEWDEYVQGEPYRKTCPDLP